MKVYPCGTIIRLIPDNMICTIKEIYIRFSDVLYELRYYYNGDFKTITAKEEEFTTDVIKSQSIGFNKPK